MTQKLNGRIYFSLLLVIQRGEVILDKNKHTCVNKTSLSGLDYESLLFSYGIVCVFDDINVYAAYYNKIILFKMWS